MGLGTGCVWGTEAGPSAKPGALPTGDPCPRSTHRQAQKHKGVFRGGRGLGASWQARAQGRPVPWPFLQRLTRWGQGGGAVPRTSDCSGCASPSPAWSPVASDADPSWCPDGPGDLGAQVCPGQRDGAPGELMFRATTRMREVSAPRLPGVGVPALCVFLGMASAHV